MLGSRNQEKGGWRHREGTQNPLLIVLNIRKEKSLAGGRVNENERMEKVKRDCPETRRKS